MTFTDVTRAHADELLRELIKTGETGRHKAQAWVEDGVKASFDRSGAFISTVRGEVRKPLKGLGFSNADDLAKKGGDTRSRTATAARKTTGPPAKKVPAKKVPAKKTAAQKAPARKVSAKKTAVPEGPATKTAGP